METLSISKSTNSVDHAEKLKLGGEYKRIKIFLIDIFKDYLILEKKNDEKEMIRLIENIRLKMFYYLEAFMVVDAYDIINIMLKKYNDINSIQIFNYIENIFNNDLYDILINHVVKKRYLVNDTDPRYKNMLVRNTMMYMGIIKIEILKINLIKSITNDEKESFLIDNNIPIYDIVYNKFWKDMINTSKGTILKYYNDLRKNFGDNKDLIENCKILIIKNNVLVKS